MQFRNVAVAASLALLSVFASSAANATLITFDDLSDDGQTLPRPTIPPGYGGFNWVNFGYVNGINYDGNPSGYHDGVVSQNNVAFNANGDPASITSGTSFSVQSFYITPAWYDGLHVTITASNPLDTLTLILSAGSPTLATLNWTDITSLTFVASGGNPYHPYNDHRGGEHFALDNLTVNAATATTPLPAALPLFASGLGAMGFIGWRRKRKAAAALPA